MPLPSPAHVLPPPSPPATPRVAVAPSGSKAVPAKRARQSLPTPSIPMAAQYDEPLPMPVVAPAPVNIAAAPVASPSAAAIEAPWRAEKGQTLKEVLRGWSEAAHVKLYWTTDYDYKLKSNISYTGNFEDAISRLLDQFSTVKPQPYGQLHRNPGTGNVLVVNTYGTYN